MRVGEITRRAYKRTTPWPLQLALRRARYVLQFAAQASRMPIDFMPYALTVMEHLGGQFDRTCTLCGFTGPFLAFGSPPRLDAKCPGCDSLERHRLFSLFIKRTNALTGFQSLIHFAPEPCLATAIKRQVPEYITADLYATSVDRRLNIEGIDIETGSIDAVICNHVFEHVNDRKAMTEIFRILRPGGTLFCSVPICDGWNRTYENPNIVSEEERTLHFGQYDHIRYYGSDFRERLKAAKFQVSEFVASGDDVAAYGLLRGETIFICEKPKNT